jgi:hypothetical protein
MVKTYTQQEVDALVEAAIEATKEKAAKKIEWYIGMNQEWFELTPQELAAAIRSME